MVLDNREKVVLDNRDKMDNRKIDNRPKMDNRKMDNRPIWIKYLDNRLASFELISTAYPKTTGSFKNAKSQSA